ncbi:zinc finger protein 414 [Parambassis ranga]|uniref:Zinc finger protein 414 n=1 Tax=Parambassis ranga TaxID=210632 RepID=A0A6P7I4T1_9TELE|nr:zinc finger protein 414 [Parambassis ranga]
MSSGSSILQMSENEPGGNKRIPCPVHCCKRAYADTVGLERHIKDHEIPAQSLPGKILRCSTLGCSSSFPNMQKLMEHIRHHHKPNIFFQCESCRTKLRSYRGLLTHLHTCSKVPRGKMKSTEPAPPQPAVATNPNMPPQAMDQPPQLESANAPQQLLSKIPNSNGSFAGGVPQPDPAAPPLLSLSVSDTSPPQLVPEAAPQPLPSSLNLDAPKAAPDPPVPQDHHQTQPSFPEPIHTASGFAPHSPPGLSAVWKKSQGITCNRRILWEHTRGRYTCVQCYHTVTNRKEMTQHISSHHSTIKASEDTDGLTPNS